MNTATLASTFDVLDLSPRTLDTLADLGMVTPTPIQATAIPIGLEGRDLFGIAQTGTGKTLAFALPIIERLKPGEQSIILAPTRELAEQIELQFKKLGMRTALLIGGAAMDRQVGWLRKKPPIIVATPGRLIDHLERRTATLKNIAIVVLDEADRMLDIGFAPAIRRILDQCPEDKQTLLFSATLSPEVEDIANRHMINPARIEIAPQGTTAERVQQEIICAEHEQKHEILKELLYEHKGSILIFTRTRHGARKVAKFARDYGHYSAEIHSDRTLAQRREALEGFRNGRYRILVATDIAARGIDVKDISLVINFDIPEHAEDYVHRIGRTARAGAEGTAITFTLPAQWKEVRDIEKLIGQIIPDSAHTQHQIKRPVAGNHRIERNRSERNLSPRNKHKGQDRRRDSEPVTQPNVDTMAQESIQSQQPAYQESIRNESNRHETTRPERSRNNDSRGRTFKMETRNPSGSDRGNDRVNNQERPQRDTNRNESFRNESYQRDSGRGNSSRNDSVPDRTPSREAFRPSSDSKRYPSRENSGPRDQRDYREYPRRDSVRDDQGPRDESPRQSDERRSESGQPLQSGQPRPFGQKPFGKKPFGQGPRPGTPKRGAQPFKARHDRSRSNESTEPRVGRGEDGAARERGTFSKQFDQKPFNPNADRPRSERPSRPEKPSSGRPEFGKSSGRFVPKKKKRD